MEYILGILIISILIIVLLIYTKLNSEKNSPKQQGELLPVPERTVMETVMGVAAFGVTQKDDIASFYKDAKMIHEQELREAKIRLAKYTRKSVKGIKEEVAKLEYARWKMLGELLAEGKPFPPNNDFGQKEKELWYRKHMLKYQIGKRTNRYPHCITDLEINVELSKK